MLKSFRHRCLAGIVHSAVWAAWLLATPFFPAASAQNEPVRVIAFGAHPDDCDLGAGGLAAKYAALGFKVKFVSLTNGDAGHQTQGGEQLAKRRRAEAQEAGRRIGIEYEVLDNHDGKLLPTLDVREQVIREIRQWKADVVIGPRSNDDPFTRPQPFRPDIVVSIDDVFQKKIDMLDAHVSQFYEWLPWTTGNLDQVPKDAVERKRWLAVQPMVVRKGAPEWRATLERRYGAEAANMQHVEAFEITEYGRQPSEQEIRRLFPFFSR